MKRLKLHRHFATIIASALLISMFPAAGQVMPADKEVIQFHSKKMGDVTFQHGKHAQLENVGGVTKVECRTCHHTLEGDTPIKPCKECHEKGKKEKTDKVPKYKEAYHLRCRGCHKYTMKELNKPAGPDKKCKLCHVKPAKK